MRRSLAILLLLIGGCVTEHPSVPSRYWLSTPCAASGTGDVVLIGSSAANKRAADGNSYTITWGAYTNWAGVDAQYQADIATNRWPKFRMHLDLSIDGGSNWIRRIGYGLQTPKGGVGGELQWSPPDDYSLLTTNARLRLVDLDGVPFRSNSTNMPYDPGTNGVWSEAFSIFGATVMVPASGATIYPNSPSILTIKQMGGGGVFDVYWATPADYGYLFSVSNVTEGVSTHDVVWPVSLPISPEAQISVRSVEHPSIVGRSGIIIVDP